MLHLADYPRLCKPFFETMSPRRLDSFTNEFPDLSCIWFRRHYWPDPNERNNRNGWNWAIENRHEAEITKSMCRRVAFRLLQIMTCLMSTIDVIYYSFDSLLTIAMHCCSVLVPVPNPRRNFWRKMLLQQRIHQTKTMAICMSIGATVYVSVPFNNLQCNAYLFSPFVSWVKSCNVCILQNA